MTTRTRARLGGLFFMSLALAAGAGAQEAGGTVAPRHGVTRAGLDSLRAVVGFRVRVKDTASSSWRVGTLGLVSRESITLRGRDDEQIPTQIPTQSLVVAQRSTGRATFNPSVVGFAIGMVVGGTAGVVIGNQHRPSFEPNGSQRSVGLAIGAAVGAGLGVLVGAALAPEHWRDIRLRE